MGKHYIKELIFSQEKYTFIALLKKFLFFLVESLYPEKVHQVVPKRVQTDAWHPASDNGEKSNKKFYSPNADQIIFEGDALERESTHYVDIRVEYVS